MSRGFKTDMGLIQDVVDTTLPALWDLFTLGKKYFYYIYSAKPTGAQGD